MKTSKSLTSANSPKPSKSSGASKLSKTTGESIVDLYRPESELSAEVRRLLHNCIRKAGGELPLSVIVSSAAMGEGKSTISSFLAVSAAVHKKLRVLLIDADLRRPNIHTLFNLDIAPGVTDLDNSGQDWNEATRELQGIKGLSILTAGVSDNRPTDHIERGVIQNVVASASKWFDLVIADSPPLLPVQDALQLAPSFDGVLLVAKAGDTNRDLTKSAVETLHRHNLPILGVTLNNALGVLPHYYGHYSYRPSQ